MWVWVWVWVWAGAGIRHGLSPTQPEQAAHQLWAILVALGEIAAAHEDALPQPLGVILDVAQTVLALLVLLVKVDVVHPADSDARPLLEPAPPPTRVGLLVAR